MRELIDNEVSHVSGAAWAPDFNQAVYGYGAATSTYLGSQATRNSLALVGRTAWGTPGGIAASAAFTGGWMVGTAIYNKYSVPIQDAIWSATGWLR